MTTACLALRFRRFAAIAAISALSAMPSAGAVITVAQGDDLAAALADANAEDTILVGPGDYECTSEFLVDKALTLQSTDGPEATTLRATTAKATADTHRVLEIAAAATVSGFTLEQAATSISGTRTGFTVALKAAGATLTNCVIRSCGNYYADRVIGAGIAMTAAGTVADCVVSNYFVRGARGGGVYMSAGTIRDSTITGCRAGNGNGEWNYGAYGAGLILHGAATASGCAISNNVSPYYLGAGVCLYNKNAVLTNCVVTGNSTRFTSGAGVFNCNGKVIDCTITDNFMYANGLRSDYQWLDGTVTDTTSTSLLPPGDGNVWTQPLPAILPDRVYCDPCGAGVFPYDTPENASTNFTLAIEAACAFARASGSTVRVDVASGTYPIYSCANVTDPLVVVGEDPATTRVRNGSNIGRAMRVTAAGATVSGLSLYGRQALCSSGGDLTLTGGGYRGGGMLLEADSTVSNCFFHGMSCDSKAAIPGGAIFASAGHVADCDMSNNAGFNAKGVVDIRGTAEMDRCTVTNNTVTYGYSSQDNGFIPGVIVAGTAKIRNCLIARNSAIYAPAGLKMNSSTAWAYHCTVVSNLATKLTSGVGLSMANGYVRNCLFAENYGGSSLANIAKSSGSIAYSMSDASVGGTGNVAATPTFADFDAADYHLALGSAGIDAGNDYGITEDLEGVVRPLDGDADGEAVPDMGCYEFQMSAEGATVFFSVDCGASVGATNAILRATVLAGGVALDDFTGVVFSWTVASPSGTSLIEGSGDDYAAIELPCDDFGTYDIELSVTLPGGVSATYALQEAVRIFAEEMYAVSDGSSQPRFPYATPATAAASLSDIADTIATGILDAGMTRAVVHLGEGTFPIGRMISSSIPLSLLGEGPEKTAIRPASGFGSRALHASGDLLLSGVAFTSFSPISGDSGGAVAVTSSRATSVQITNCVFNACTTTGNPEGGALYVNVNAATTAEIVDSVFRNSLAASPAWRSTVYLQGAGVLMDRCVVTNNCSGDAGWKGHCISGVKLFGGARLRNSLVADNRTLQVDSSQGARGAAVMVGGSSVAENCTIVANRTMNGRLTTAVGLYLDGGSAVNCVVADNEDVMNSVTRDLTDSQQRLSYSIVEGVTYGEGNLSVHPVFRDASAGDWRLAPGTPGIDAGLAAPWMEDGLDLNRSPRRAGRVDMGCYEAPCLGTMMMFL